MARILLGITGGIAAYKACELTRLLVRAGHDVVPLTTPAAERFVAARTFRALARRGAAEGPFPHLERADLLVVAPLTANTLAKLAHGLADGVLTEAALAHTGPVLLAPAMNGCGSVSPKYFVVVFMNYSSSAAPTVATSTAAAIAASFGSFSNAMCS